MTTIMVVTMIALLLLGFPMMIPLITAAVIGFYMMFNGFGQMEPVELVEHNHVEWCRGCPLFLEPVNVQIVVVGSSIGELVDQRGIPVIGKDDGFVPGEQGIEIRVAEAVRMLAF